jgi:hypothetical protein
MKAEKMAELCLKLENLKKSILINMICDFFSNLVKKKLDFFLYLFV